MSLPLPIISSKNMNTNVKLSKLFYKYTGEKPKADLKTEMIEHALKKPEDYESYPPYNFSWFIENKIAAMAWPQTVANLNYLSDVGVDHLITLSTEKVPPILECKKKLKWTEINIKEFGAPTLKQILKFIEICERAELRGETVGVHCRQGRGRTGTMLACYLVHFKGMAPERAVLTVRVLRPGSCETYEQEKAVCHYHDCVRGTIDKPDWRLVDDKPYFDASMRQMSDEEIQDSVEEVEEKKTQEQLDKEREERRKERAARRTSMVIHHKIYF